MVSNVIPSSFKRPLLLLVAVVSIQAFVPTLQKTCPIALPTLASQSNRQHDTLDDAEPTAADIRQFLNQCSIQSFLFLLTQTRDPHTIKWIDTFTRPNIACEPVVDTLTSKNEPAHVHTDKQLSSKLLNYHGLSAMNTTLFPTWDSYFKSLLQEDPCEIIVTSNNPLVKEFVIDINPASLSSRILAVRSQIAKEWETDLNVIANLGSQMFYSYWNNVEQRRTKGMSNDDDEQRDDTTEDSPSGWINVPPLSSQDASPGFERTSLSFLEWDPNEDSEYAPSPLRKGNFDLLVLLSTQESIRRILSQQQEPDSTHYNTAEAMFLASFYMERRHEYFSRGSGRYGRADDFLEELMLLPPSIVLEKYSEENVLIDPLRLAEVIVLEREKLCEEWAEVARVSPSEHYEIQKLQLDRMMNM